MRWLIPEPGHVEVRQKGNGTWTVWYPDPAFIPCPPGCDLARVLRSHKHLYERTFFESYYHPTDYEDALAWADILADGREVKIIPFKTRTERAEEKRAGNGT